MSLKPDLYLVAKRAFDLVAAALMLVVLSPLLLSIALLVRLSSRGPILFRGERVGRGGRRFLIYKFRTMVMNADQVGGASTPIDDPRITSIGRILRRYKLDELPQLVNVLRGEMSLVGPRPQVPWEVELYATEYPALLDLKPGMADYAFLVLPLEGELLRGSAEAEKDYVEKIHPKKIRVNLEYLERRSFTLDLQILIKASLASILGGRVMMRP